ncbi:MAG: UvrD-helicase domain-containing protein [Caldimicrobium sp.]
MTELTEEQRAIIEYFGDLLVLAGPGTGKTFTLIHKIKNLLERGIPQEKIIVLSYSLKVTKELKEKIKSSGLTQIKVDTFHGFAYDLYRNYYQKEPPLITEKEKKAILKKLSLNKKSLKKPEERKEFQDYLEKQNLLDFDLLLIKTSSLPGIDFTGYHIIIDEFQDLSMEMLQFLKLFKSATFYLFGDPNQSIYGFRGISLKAIKEFLEKTKPQIRYFTLTESFRCPQEILDGASWFKNSLWEVPKFKSRFCGGVIQGFLFPDLSSEKSYLIKWVQNLLGGISLEKATTKGISPSDIFILARVKKALDPLCEVFHKEGIPIAFPEEEAMKIKEELTNFREKLNTSITPFEFLIEELSPYAKNLLINWYELFSHDIEKVKVMLIDLAINDIIFPNLQGINFMTIHASKGLEAKVVILYGAEEDLIPFKLFEDINLEEERRLLYVAITRSKKDFYFIANKERKIFGYTLNKGVSSWLKIFPIKSFTSLSPKPKQKGLF